jgi:hypothetical protein
MISISGESFGFQHKSPGPNVMEIVESERKIFRLPLIFSVYGFETVEDTPSMSNPD